MMSTRTSVGQSSISQSSSAMREDGPTTLAPDDVFHLLQNRRRRLVLRYLTEHDTPAVEMREVAEQVAAWENDTTVAALTSDARQRVYIALYQSHLPKLDERGVIEYDQNRGTIEPCASLSQLEPYLSSDTVSSEPIEQEETDDEEEMRWSWQWNDHYLGLAVLSMLAVLGVALSPIGSGIGLWLSAIIAGVFGVSALAQRF